MTPKNKDSATRNIVAQFVEELNADSVIVMWTTVSKDITSAKVVTYGNQFACRAMVKAMHDDYVLKELNAMPKPQNPRPRKDDKNK